MRALILVALLLSAVPAFADDTLVPTEGGEIAGDADQGSAPTGCHRCVGNPDGGWSDSDYSNPTGAWQGGHDPGHSQDWYNNTGPYNPSECTVQCEWSTAMKKQHPKANKTARAPAIGQGGRNFTNGGGNDHSKTR